MKHLTFVVLFLGLTKASVSAGQWDVERLRAVADDDVVEGVADDDVVPVEGGSDQEDADPASSEPANALAPQAARSDIQPPFANLIAHVIPDSDGVKLASCDRCRQECTNCCCPPPEWTMFGQWLLLQPRNGDLPYAERSPSCLGPPIGTEQIDFGSFSGIKVGLTRSLDDCHAITGSFTYFAANEDERSVSRPGIDVLRPVLAFDPFVTCDDASSTRARASAGIDFRRADIDYRAFIDRGCCSFDWLVGFAYGQLNQDIRASYDTGRVSVESDAWGYGARFGGGAQCGTGRVRGFSHLDLTLLASNLTADYTEIDDTQTTVARVERDLDRIIPVLDIELGLAMDVRKNTVLKLGYVYSIWFNVVTIPDFIESARDGDLSGPSSTLTFDGLFARLEYMW